MSLNTANKWSMPKKSWILILAMISYLTLFKEIACYKYFVVAIKIGNKTHFSYRYALIYIC